MVPISVPSVRVQTRRRRWYCPAEGQIVETVFVFAVELCRIVCEIAAPAFITPGIAGGRVEERF